VSNALSERGAFQKAVDEAQEKARGSVAPPAAPQRKKPGTQLMANAPGRPLPSIKDAAAAAAGEEPPKPAKKPVPRTQVMGFNPAAGMNLPGAKPTPQSASGIPAAPNAPGSSPSGLSPASPLPSGVSGVSSVGLSQQPASMIQPGGNMPQSVGGPNMPQSVIGGNMPQSVGGPNMPQSVIQPSGPMQPSQAQPLSPHGGSGAPGVSPMSGLGMQPPSVIQQPPQSAYASQAQGGYPQAGYGQQPPPQQNVPAGPGGWGWNSPTPGPGQPMPQPMPPSMVGQPQAPQAPYQYQPFGYSPGSRVHVTWSNGQRYPATVSQVSGSQCLVVFPDGQQHWVEMQYLSPG